MRLYRYVRALETIKCGDHDEVSEVTDISEKLKKSIQESKLFFSHPASFNDPLECTIPITIENHDKKQKEYAAYLESIISKRVGSRNDESKRSKRIYEASEYGISLENCLVACFSEDGNNQLMWSHYADQHKGVCLCYEFPDTLDEFEKQVKWSGLVDFNMNNYGLTVQSASVVYQTKRPSLHISNTSLPVDKWSFDSDYAIKDAIFTKPECWMYEKEWRLALTLPFGSETAFAAGISTSDYYAVIPREWLKEVTFGLRLEKEYCEKIKRISIDNGYSTTEFKKAQMAYGEFKIIIEPY